MSMYDDLEPAFVPSPGAALPAVAARVHQLRRRRRVAAFSAASVLAAVSVLVSVAFGAVDGRHRLTVANPTTTSAVSSTTSAEPSTTTTAPTVTTGPVVPPPSVSTPPLPGRISVAFDRPRLVIKSGTKATISFTVTNDGDTPAAYSTRSADCARGDLWPDDVSRTEPVRWAAPYSPHRDCSALTTYTVQPHQSQTIERILIAGQRTERNYVVPAPPGETSFAADNWAANEAFRLPVTITPPAQPPVTVIHPSEVTTPSDGQHVIDFTVTNHLGFRVRYIDAGPCSWDSACYATTPDHAISMDMRLPPYDTALKPLYLSHFVLGADEVKTAQAQVHGTRSLEDIGLGSPGLPPGVYHFYWDGEKVKFTITPATG